MREHAYLAATYFDGPDDGDDDDADDRSCRAVL
jgi:hypothetical protein